MSFFVSSALLTLAVSGTFLYPVLDNTSVYNVTAEVEQITVKVFENPRANWYLNEVGINYPHTDKNSDACIENEEVNASPPEKFSGSMQLGNNIEIIFTRIGLSKLVIQLLPLPKSTDDPQKQRDKDWCVIGELYAQDEEHVNTIRYYAVITIEDIEMRLKQGKSQFFNISGTIHLADTKDYPDSDIKPVLKEGEVSILERSFIFGDNYLIGPYQLGLGDSLDLIQQQGREEDAEGFVVAGLVVGDTMQGLKTVYSVEAKKGIISRYKFDGYEIAANPWSRLFHDQILGYLWMLFAFSLSTFVFLLELSIDKKE